MSQRIADDFEFIRERLGELQREKAASKPSPLPPVAKPGAVAVDDDLCPCFRTWGACYGCFG